MFDSTFLAGVIVLFLTFLCAFWLAGLTGANPALVLAILAAGTWSVVYLIERRLMAGQDGPPEVIHVDWDARLSDTDFDPFGASTMDDLTARGLTPETAIGQRFVFATESETSNGDIWFEGRFQRGDDGRVLIRSTEPL